MFHAYRSGKHPISAKVWRKLAAAELAAGIGQLDEVPSPPQASPPTPSQHQAFNSPADAALVAVLERIATALEQLARGKT